MESVFNNISKLFFMYYGLEVTKVEKASAGVGSDTWFVTCEKGKYVMKYPSESEMNHPEQEPILCEYLNECGVSACQFIKNLLGNYLTEDEQGKMFHVQRFVQGKVYEWHSAPRWLLTESAHMLGKIHAALKDYRRLPVGIGEDFFQHMTPEAAKNSYQKSLTIAKKQGDKEVVEDLSYRIELMKRFPEFSFYLDKLTCQSTHGDYFISQFICGENRIHSVIDWTTACIHPVVWEIMRSYVYAAPSCRDGVIDMDEFVDYVREYCKYAPLTRYDVEHMVDLFYYQIAVCDYYGQYYGTDADNRNIFLEQAKLSTKLLKWLEVHRGTLKEKLKGSNVAVIPETEKILLERFGKDSIIALATTLDNVPYVRNVNAFYEDGCFYILTYGLSNKMKQIQKNPNVAIAGDWFTAQGKGVNLGYFGKEENVSIAEKMREVFAGWIDNGHNDFADENTCILRIELTKGILFSKGTRYELDFTEGN